ncbi:hypothetical protein [Priestia taiwanensis]|uniref:Asp/Glu/Hydantoin racemase n=1 Tax=Priestia taiwanensis TaxID=1347902 RepID=A0A917EU75_9BACI|nr:hypothetical protein [Priestia taiwanensis]MBM7365040.1 hypothetical protein [Priestia taiwanensis]GGE83582.1 hypothetical protein GCM10007140_36390 [Priestia taiwanensis]
MRKRIGCLHAHHSNCAYIEQALANYYVEFTHVVGPVLGNQGTSLEQIRPHVKFLAESKVDAILITCTNYIALLQGEELQVEVPIIKLDEPYFEQICRIERPQIITFTNPETVQGTMNRLYAYAEEQGTKMDVDVRVIDGTFELIMQGRKVEYDDAIEKALMEVIMKEHAVLSVAQLSMVDATKRIEERIATVVLNPLEPLIDMIIERVGLEKIVR